MKLFLPTLIETQRLAKSLAPLMHGEDTVLLRGDLGAGKTTFARALLRCLGVDGEVPSPTFTLVQSYDTERFTVFHFDLYRLKVGEEIEEIGFDDAVNEGLVLVEWPEKAESYMPRDALSFTFSLDKSGTRVVEIKAPLKWKERLGALNVSN